MIRIKGSLKKKLPRIHLLPQHFKVSRDHAPHKGASCMPRNIIDHLQPQSEGRQEARALRSKKKFFGFPWLVEAHMATLIIRPKVNKR
jgi:hypothetical protein